MDMNPTELRLLLRNKCRTAGTTFIVVMGLIMIGVVGFGLTRPEFQEKQTRFILRMVGMTAVYAGAMFVVSTGLFKRWRWAAIVAVVWGVGLWALQIVAFLTDPSQATSPAESGAETIGGLCPGLFLLAVIITSARAALAQRPVENEAPINLDAEFEHEEMTPYGRRPEEVNVRPAYPVVALGFIAVGISLLVGGAALLGYAANRYPEFVPNIEEPIAESLDRWQVYEYPEDGFAIELPGEPLITDDVVDDELVVYSRVFEVARNTDRFEVTHYRVKSYEVVAQDALKPGLDSVVSYLNATVTHTSSEPLAISNGRERPALHYEVELSDGGRGFLLSTCIRHDVYVVVALEANPEHSKSAKRVVDSFVLLD